jgi:hypothetical protein
VELLFQVESRSVSFGTKVVPSLNGVDPSFMNSVAGSPTCRDKWLKYLHDMALCLRGFIFIEIFWKVLLTSAALVATADARSVFQGNVLILGLRFIYTFDFGVRFEV